MLKVLWLCSWYPNKLDAFEGDFIQRHAQATSLFCGVHTIKLTPDVNATGVSFEISKHKEYPNLTEELIYYPKKNNFLGKIRSYFRWYHLYKKAVKNYIAQNGQPDLVHVHIPFKSGIIAQWIKRKYKIPYVVTEHWGGYNIVVDDNFYERPKWFQKTIKNTFGNAKAIHSVSEYLARQICNIVKVNATLIPNCVNTNFFYHKPKIKDHQVVKALHISNGVKVKNLEGIVNVFKQLDVAKYFLEIVGLPPEHPIHQAKYENITSRGVVPYAKIGDQMREADVLIIFSHMENSPCVIGEALSCGLPIIATDVGGINELVDNRNAVLINSNDEEALQNAILSLKHMDYSSDAIANDASKKFSYSNIGQQTLDFYKKAIV